MSRVTVAGCMLEFHLPACRNLKAKRAFLNRLKSRLRNRFNVAVAEVEHQDLWQRTTVGVVSLSNDRDLLTALMGKIVDEAETHHDGVLVSAEIEYW